MKNLQISFIALVMNLIGLVAIIEKALRYVVSKKMA